MKYIQLALLSLLVSYSLAGQEWNSTGNNTTTGSILLNSDSFVSYAIERGNGAKSFFGITSNSHEGFLSSSGSLKFLTNNNGTTYNTTMFLNSNGNVGIGTTSISEKLHLKGNLYVDSGINDNKIYWNGHNMTMGTRPGAYTHNIFHLKPGGASQGVLYSYFKMYTAVSESEHQLSLQLSSTGNSFFNGGNVGIGTTVPAERLEVKGNLYVNSGVNDNKIYWNGHNMTMGTRPGAYTHNVFHLKPGGASQGMLFSKFNMYNASSQSEQELKIQLHSNGNSFINSGNVGIGTTTPAAGLEVKKDSGIKVSSATFGSSFGGVIKMADGFQNTTWRDDMLFSTSGGFMFKMDEGGNGISNGGSAVVGFNIYNRSDESVFAVQESTGNVGIGTTDTKGFKLGVNGDIAATKIKVALYNNWPDYVFEDTYVLPTLKEVENHINEKGHLQNVPSAKEVGEKGFFLEEMDSKLLQKIEELTLYTIAQEKQIEKLTKENEAAKLLQEQLQALAKRVAELEKTK